MFGRTIAFCLLASVACAAADDGTRLAAIYAEKVNKRFEVPVEEQRRYADLLAAEARARNISGAQYIVLVDRSPLVQAVMIFWMDEAGTPRFIGASPASTGKPGRFEHFLTPTGVFEHTIDNLDFRALGTKNEEGIRGYGAKGMRIFDFGWQKQVRGWGKGTEGILRLQMHATDPQLLETRLGTAQSKGCIRIPATLNLLLDHYGILDGDYEKAMAEGKTFWVLPKDREPTPWSGKYLVVIDSGRKTRPDWAVPAARH